MLHINFCGQRQCCDQEDDDGETEFSAVPIFDDHNYMLESSAPLGQFIIDMDEEKQRATEVISASPRYRIPSACPAAPPVVARSMQSPRCRAPAAPNAVAASQGQVFGSPACLYQPDPNDALDLGLVQSLSCLDNYARATLILRRTAPGHYEIDGRQCRLFFDASAQIKVQEDGTDVVTPLIPYITQAAHVAVSLSRPKHRRAQEKQYSFDHTKILPGSGVTRMQSGEEIGDDARTQSMEVAVLQARIREQATFSGASRAFTPRVVSGLSAKQ